MYMYIYTHICMYVYIYIYTYVSYIYIYIYIPRLAGAEELIETTKLAQCRGGPPPRGRRLRRTDVPQCLDPGLLPTRGANDRTPEINTSEIVVDFQWRPIRNLLG